jgi:hypothetical protein
MKNGVKKLTGAKTMNRGRLILQEIDKKRAKGRRPEPENGCGIK